jgi:hypothetical protein
LQSRSCSLPYLLYCITESDAGLSAPNAGVQGAEVSSISSTGLRCFYSSVQVISSDSAELKKDALEFFRVTHVLFQQTAIIPFRFPTTLPDEAAIRDHLENRQEAYLQALSRFRETVQMEIRISAEWSSTAAQVGGSSGTKYLQNVAQHKRNVENALAACRAAINEEVIDFRQRNSVHGVRCFALVRREAVTQFQDHIQRVRLDPAVKAAVSGPWPPIEFFPDFV